MEENQEDPLSIYKNLKKDLTVYFSDAELAEMSNMQMSSHYNDVIGRITSIEAIRETVDYKKLALNPDDDSAYRHVLNFDLTTKAQKPLKIAVWNEHIPRIQPSIILGDIVCIEGLYANPAAQSTFNNHRDYNLTCQGLSHVFSLKKLNNIIDDNVHDKKDVTHYEDIQDAIDNNDGFDAMIALTVFVKSKFVVEKNNVTIGAVSDKKLKMRTKIMNDVMKENFERGQFVKAYGNCKMESDKIIFVIKNSDDVEILNISKVPLTEECKNLESPKKKLRKE